MPELSGFYDSAPIQPLCRIKETFSVFSGGNWNHCIVDYLEGIPPGPASQVDMVVQTGGTQVAANATINKSVVAILQLNQQEFLHLRWEPTDPVEGVLWELSGEARLYARNIHSRVDRATRSRDPFLATTTFFIWGQDRDINLEARNPMAYALPSARFQFFGYRGVWSLVNLDRFKQLPDWATIQLKLAQGDRETVRTYIGPTVWIPAQGKV